MLSKKQVNKKISCLFLDRDGVINIDYGYVYKEKDFQFIDGVLPTLQKLSKANVNIIIVTNQSGIARGYFSEKDFMLINRYMLKQFNENKINILDVFMCPHHPEGKIDKYKKICDCRKPKPGLINAAVDKYNINVKKSVLIGDKKSDIEAGINANIKNLYQVGKTKVSSNLKVESYESLEQVMIKNDYFKGIIFD